MAEPLRVLFYEDPLTDHHAFGWRAPHVALDACWLNALASAGCDVRMLVHDGFAKVAMDAGVAPDALLVLHEDDVRRGLPGPQLDVNTLFHRHYGALTGLDPVTETSAEFDLAVAVRGHLAGLVEPLIREFEPDVIVTWVPAPHLRLISEALILHKETGIYARSPYPISYFLDPLGLHRWSCARRFDAVTSTPASRQAFDGLKVHLERAVSDTADWPDFDRIAAQSAGTLFVPAQMSGGFLYDGACDYRSQTHMILDVLRRAPKDWAVIVNDHPDCLRLSAWERDYLTGLYPNFHYWTNTIYAEGQKIVRRADVIATVSSSLGLQGLLWNKTVVALGDSHIGAFTPFSRVDLSSPTHDASDHRHAAAWLSFNYCYQDHYATRPRWLADHLRGRLAQWRKAGAAGYFDEPWAPPSEIADFIGARIDAERLRAAAVQLGS